MEEVEDLLHLLLSVTVKRLAPCKVIQFATTLPACKVFAAATANGPAYWDITIQLLHCLTGVKQRVRQMSEDRYCVTEWNLGTGCIW